METDDSSGEASDMPGDFAIQLAEMQQTDARRGGILTAWFRLNGPAVLHQQLSMLPCSTGCAL
ncbi:hypothetical protein GWE18_36825 [Bradyrhizobium sp. CSA112]|uniref:hypothetical protein n=1 Tax=Bradyrhizobium sp. CSA112 TaxID=2699170 RepID=UPI0023AE9F1A|nr:hypothetical protein [Bradyrhizobium sp. CSA112]MDE5458271.1 hypothetical protein [Bradyrhizobium sp. CSA112]